MLFVMDEKSASKALRALGHEARLHVFRLLVQAGKEGLNVGQIGDHVGIAPSTLSHHLKALCDAGLVIQEKRSREVVSYVDFPLMDGLLAYMTEACCLGVPEIGTDQSASKTDPSHLETVD